MFTISGGRPSAVGVQHAGGRHSVEQAGASNDTRRCPHFKIRMRVFPLLLAVISIGGCASLSHEFFSLDGSSTANPDKVATIDVEADNPLLIQGLDGKLLESVKFQSAFRTWSFVVSPGRHILWLSSTPYGHPLVPQRHRCYSMEVFLSPGGKYGLREMPGKKCVQLLLQAGRVSVATGQLVDNPWVFESGCRWK